ncbi:MAG TPA: dipeptide ABC transporter ATP-binding protein [Dermatophilaceae bacterium]|nr:dipeptide ABC transporter ATP-binding protein [Dermatophilaceae bacterium]
MTVGAAPQGVTPHGGAQPSAVPPRGTQPAGPPGEQPLLRVRGLTKLFPIRRGLLQRQVGAVHAVEDVTFDLSVGQTLSLVGESGCGKTTTGRLITRLIEPSSGTVELNGQDISHLGSRQMRPLRRDIQMIFQDPYGSLNPRHTVGTIVGAPFQIQGVKAEHGTKRAVQDLLELVGLSPEHYNRYPHEFSGGQRQRIGIARALALRPKVIVADEPVSALDVSIQAQVINLLEDLQRELELTYVVIAHDLSVVRHISDRVAVMYLGSLVEVADRLSLYTNPLHPYTTALLSAVPLPDPRRRAHRERIRLVGDVPSPVDPPNGCRFHTRCPWRQPTRCDTERPQLRTIAGSVGPPSGPVAGPAVGSAGSGSSSAGRIPSDHQVACHWAEGIRAGTLQPKDVEAVAVDPSAGLA